MNPNIEDSTFNLKDASLRFNDGCFPKFRGPRRDFDGKILSGDHPPG